MTAVPPQTLGHLMRDTSGRAPQRAAIIDLSVTPPKQLDYSELDQELDAIAAGAQAAGIRQGQTVLIVLGNRLEFITAVFGLMRAGIVPSPVNPQLSEDDLAFQECGLGDERAVEVSRIRGDPSAFSVAGETGFAIEGK